MTNASVGAALTRRDARIAHALQLTAQNTDLVCRVEKLTEGEVAVDVFFPVEFTSRPYFNGGGAVMEKGCSRIPSFAPAGSATIIEWITKRASGVIDHYIGAKVLCIVDGPEGTKMSLDLVFTGQAYTGAR